MVLKIAICDDEEIFLEELLYQMSVELRKTDTKFHVTTYMNGVELLSDNEKEIFDLVVLDIEMPHLNGIEVAEQIRQRNPYVCIIFITNREDLVFQSLRYRPFRFIRKSKVYEELPEAIDGIIQKLNSENQYYTLSFNNSPIQLRISDIMYIESIKHDIYFNCQEQKYRVKSNLSKLEKEFGIHGFIRVHSGFLVNYRYIYSIDKTKVILNNKEMVPLSRHRLETVKQKLQLYARGMQG
ncbi:DNA-binding response regulator [Anaerocolumna cellulosilytica]|uniref:Stage 0 sporulation protein A homolog n=1 Tax=Anaerocolumna cellulosilytica TaxID=433286 RepID=A0A6S6QY73_9FIRM|nr:LytTR family DNA-binding domain-containing protein [Anaerocolumna cellulosilytica]MBB5196225.1 DNA-binding LytR/AlgR family response regulator [Anaerocolumna cellulosilytica]BCJ92455.1 DNA-binding response regulator [Anaerocolumna cellulosilytica]